MGLRNMRGKWQYRFSVKGQNICVATGLAATERNRSKALLKEAAHRQAILDGTDHQPIKPRRFTDALSEFLQWLPVGHACKASTARRIATSMTSCRVFFANDVVSQIRPADVERYKVWRLTERTEQVGGKPIAIPPVKPITVNHDLDALSIFFQWAVLWSYARRNPLKEIRRPSVVGAMRERVLTLAEEKTYFANAKGNLAAVARLILLQGMRPDEVYRLRIQDVDLERGVLRIVEGKTPAARRTLTLTQESMQILGRQIAAPFGKSKKVELSTPWVFPSPRDPRRHITKLNNPHDRVCDKTGIRMTIYGFRHTFATRMVEAGVSLTALSQILGHSRWTQTARYVHPNQAHQDDAMKIYDQLNEQRRAAETVQ